MNQPSEQTPRPSRYLLHADDLSWGLYKFPLNGVDVTDNPHRENLRHSASWWRSARDATQGIRVHGPLLNVRKGIRVVGDVVEVNSWYRTGLKAAPLVFFQALPSYWMSRFRFVGPAKDLRTAATTAFDISSFLKKRSPQRHSLERHSESLHQKAWAIRYHRAQLNNALDAAVETPNDIYFITVAGAEFAALGHSMYSLLEELADVLALMLTMQGRNATPSSFHDLHKSGAPHVPELQSILEAATWYEEFRVERGGNAHAFATLARQSETNDIQLWQHPDRRNPVKDPPAPRGARQYVDLVTQGFDTLVERWSEFMLTLFHPFDTVTLTQASPGELHYSTITSWVSEITFASDAEYGGVTWAALAADGAVKMATDERGALVQVCTELELEAG